MVKRTSPVASSRTQATHLYLPRSMARMVLVDAVVEIVFMVQASVGGKWEFGNLKNFQITTSPTACMDSLER